jgi:flagellar biosynthesis GTPase FlhF
MSSLSLSLYVGAKVRTGMEDMTLDVVRRAIEECGRRYGFDANEACRELGVNMVTVDGKKEKKEKKVGVSVSPSFPLPYSGEMKEECCHGLKQNHGLYTQCQQVLKGDAKYCKGCNTQAEKNENGEPDYGSMESRMAVGIFEYVDPKGKKPTAYTKIMKKYKVTEEQVVAEAAKFGVTIYAGHFELSAESKRGRPKTAAEKPVKGVKGRPKKNKKVVELCDDATEDLFADLVASANKDSDSEAESDTEVEAKAVPVIDEKKLAKAEAKEAEKLAKLAAKEAEKLAKEAEKLAKEQEKLAKEAEKKAKTEAKEAEKLAKAAAKEAKTAAKDVKTATAKESTETQEPDKVKRFEFEGVKYLKSKNTGIIYNMEQEVVGKWNEQSNKIDFKEAEEEEEEEEYEDE